MFNFLHFWRWKSLSCVWFFATPWTIQSLEFSRPEYWSGEPFPFDLDRIQVSCIAGRFFTIWTTGEVQEYWSGEPIPSPGDLLNPGIKPGSPALQADSLPTGLQGKSYISTYSWIYLNILWYEEEEIFIYPIKISHWIQRCNYKDLSFFTVL